MHVGAAVAGRPLWVVIFLVSLLANHVYEPLSLLLSGKDEGFGQSIQLALSLPPFSAASAEQVLNFVFIHALQILLALLIIRIVTFLQDLKEVVSDRIFHDWSYLFLLERAQQVAWA